MLVTNLTDDTFVLSAGVILLPSEEAPDGVEVADATYQADSTLNQQLDALEQADKVTITDKPTDTFPGGRLSATVTTDPDTFEVTHIFDLGGVCAAVVNWTLLEADPDGETYGYDENGGPIAFDVAYCYTASGEDEFDLVGYTAQLTSVGTAGYYGTWDYDMPYFGPDEGILGSEVPDRQNGAPGGSAGALPVHTHRMHGVCLRYLKTMVRAVDGYSLSTYGGSNHPTATWRIDVDFA